MAARNNFYGKMNIVSIHNQNKMGIKIIEINRSIFFDECLNKIKIKYN